MTLATEINEDPLGIGYAGMGSTEIYTALTTKNRPAKMAVESALVRQWFLLNDLWVPVKTSSEVAAILAVDALGMFETFEMQDPLVAAKVDQMLSGLVAVGLMTAEQKTQLMAMSDTLISRADELGLNVRLRDVIAIKEPGKEQISHSNVVRRLGRKNRNVLLVVTLPEALPEVSSITYAVRNKLGEQWEAWKGSSITGLTSIQAPGVYSARLPGEFIRSDEAEIRVTAPYNVAINLAVEDA